METKKVTLKELGNMLSDLDLHRSSLVNLVRDYPEQMMAALTGGITKMIDDYGSLITIDQFCGGKEDPVEEQDEVIKNVVPETLYSYSVKELIDMCSDAGIHVVKNGRAKKYYIDKLTSANNDDDDQYKTISELKEKCRAKGIDVTDGLTLAAYEQLLASAEENEAIEQTPTDPYEGKSSVELYKICQSRNITAKPMQRKEVYLQALTLDDANVSDEVASTVGDDDDDEWDI